jgi:AcrR family transcriptional regulator
MKGDQPPRRRRPGRAATERALLEAFEGLFERRGVAGVGVNAVLDSAGVGKRLLYDYFGDLDGLAQAWAQERPDPLALAERAPQFRKRLARLAPSARIAAILEDYAGTLRGHPWAGEVLLADLQPQQSLSRAIRDIRRAIGSGHEQLLLDPELGSNRQLVEVAFILHAAANYLALRARFAPDYNGIKLDTASGWQAAMRMLKSTASSGGGKAKTKRAAAPKAAPGTRARPARDTRAAGRRSSAASRPKRAR